MNTDFLGKDKFVELLVKGGVTVKEEQEKEWRKVQLYFLAYFVENGLALLNESEKKIILDGLDQNKPEEIDRLLQRLTDFFAVNKDKYNLQELTVKSGKQAYNKYLELIKEGGKK